MRLLPREGDLLDLGLGVRCLGGGDLRGVLLLRCLGGGEGLRREYPFLGERLLRPLGDLVLLLYLRGDLVLLLVLLRDGDLVLLDLLDNDRLLDLVGDALLEDILLFLPFPDGDLFPFRVLL